MRGHAQVGSLRPAMTGTTLPPHLDAAWMRPERGRVSERLGAKERRRE